MTGARGARAAALRHTRRRRSNWADHGARTQADFIRNGNANQIMKMSKEHTTQLWHAVVDNDLASFSSVYARLLDAPSALKHVPIRIYIPS